MTTIGMPTGGQEKERQGRPGQPTTVSNPEETLMMATTTFLESGAGATIQNTTFANIQHLQKEAEKTRMAQTRIATITSLDLTLPGLSHYLPNPFAPTEEMEEGANTPTKRKSPQMDPAPKRAAIEEMDTGTVELSDDEEGEIQEQPMVVDLEREDDWEKATSR